jgi:cysteine desulfurase/selenocysteine lyase
MIRSVSLEERTRNDLPFEAGTPAIGDRSALGAPVDYLEGIGTDAIQAHERALTSYGYELLTSIPEVTQYGPPPERRGEIFSFTLAGVHPHDVAQVLAGEGIAVRPSHHCTEPAGSVRRERSEGEPPLWTHTVSFTLSPPAPHWTAQSQVRAGSRVVPNI